jgi:hypothetical protein
MTLRVQELHMLLCYNCLMERKGMPREAIGIFSVLLILVVILGGYLFFNKNSETEKSSVTDIAVARPNLVVHGTNLDQVEIWVVPTGTNILPDDYHQIGSAKLAETEDNVQTWNFVIPEEPVLATSIFAKGYAKGKLIGHVALPSVGATAIYESLWGSTTDGTPLTPEEVGSSTEE